MFHANRSTQGAYAIMNEAMSKEIMRRTRLRNKFLKDTSEESKNTYSTQRNYCI